MSTPAPLSPLQQLSDDLVNVVGRAAQSVVTVQSARARSSGILWRPGLIVTADESLADDGDISVALPGGDGSTASLIGRDPSTDVALLRVNLPMSPQCVLEPVPVRVGAAVLVVGSQGNAPIAAFGIVSFVGGAWRSLRGGEIDARVELSLALNRAGEGSIVLDASRRAFGMAVFGPRRQILVIPATTIERVAGTLLAHGRVARGYLGLGLQPVRLDADEQAGVMVIRVDRNGPGAIAGIRQGDIISKWNEQQIQGVRMLLRALGSGSVGSTVTLELQRGGEPTKVSLTIAERPEA